MTTRDPYNSILTVQTLVPAARTATATGTTVDRASSGAMYQAAVLVVHTGVMTDGTQTVELQDSPDGSTWTAVDDAYLQGTERVIVATDDNKVFELGYLGRQRYLRAVVTAAGTTTGGVYGAVIVLANPRVSPVVHP